MQSIVPPSSATNSSEGNILILDVRPFEDFEKAHVYGARHYDIAQLGRSTNNLPREVYFYKGPVECDKMVVLYDQDGKEGTRIGNSFVEKGVENTYVVSGGFLALCATCPNVLMGDVPTDETLAAMMAHAGLLKGPGSARGGSARGGYPPSTAGSVRTQMTRLTSSVAGSNAPRAWK